MNIDGENEDLDLDTETGEEQEIEAQSDQEEQQEAQAAAEPEGDDDDLLIEIEGEEPEDETPLVKQLRQKYRESQRELQQYKAAVKPKPVDLGPKPTLESCDWDEARFEERLDAWKAAKADAERAGTDQEQEQRARQEAFQVAHAKYRAQAMTLGVKDFEQAEQAVVAALPAPVQEAIVKYFDSPARLVAALGKNPGVLSRISAESDPIRQLFALRDLEKKVQIKRKSPPAPEAPTIPKGSAPLSRGSADKKLAALEKKARETGDRTEVVRYKKSLNKKAA